jgi:hypothetical protein
MHPSLMHEMTLHYSTRSKGVMLDLLSMNSPTGDAPFSPSLFLKKKVTLYRAVNVKSEKEFFL